MSRANGNEKAATAREPLQSIGSGASAQSARGTRKEDIKIGRNFAFEAMLAAGALEEARDNMNDFNVSRPADKAIGAPELIAHLRGEISLEDARERAVIATRQYAKRQRTWFKARMSDWQHLPADTI